MRLDIEIYINNILVKTYYRYKDDFIAIPRVGEYIMLSSSDVENIDEVQIEDDFDDNGNIEVLVTKVVHDLEYDNIFVHTKTKRRKL